LGPKQATARIATHAIGNASQPGAAWLSAKQSVADGFVTEFSFQISGVEQNPGDGFAFVIQNSYDRTLGGQVGLGEASGMGYKGMSDSVAVEFDTTFHDYENDPDEDHIAVHTSGTEPNTTHQRASLGSAVSPVELWDGQLHEVRIEYSPGTLAVFLDASVPILEVELNVTDTRPGSTTEPLGSASQLLPNPASERPTTSCNGHSRLRPREQVEVIWDEEADEVASSSRSYCCVGVPSAIKAESEVSAGPSTAT
jgi:hypothetical protein